MGIAFGIISCNIPLVDFCKVDSKGHTLFSNMWSWQ